MGVPRIRTLPPSVADAIAAGEVIERPASVVKELCENSLDAGATRVEIESTGGGLTRLCVSDDGGGIEAADLPRAVERHATSKIAATADLARIATLGFRGEALASIAAVSDLRLTSRPAADLAASTVRVLRGEVVEARARASAPGTVVEVVELFSATPARLRFLRSARAEASAIVRAVSDLALASPEVAFLCRSEGRLALRSPGGSLRDAARAVLGNADAEALLDLDGGGGEIVVSGAISPPDRHRGSRAALVLVVNGRRVHNRPLVFAIEEAYRGLLPGGRHPYGVVRVSLDPERVDVNVHPAKREVRFREESAVFAAVQRACWAVLSGAGPPVVGVAPGPASAPLVLGDGAGRLGYRATPPARPSSAEVSAAIELHLPLGTSDEPAEGLPLRALGQVGTEWLVASGGDEVVLIDPHAAHEKVLYAELREAWRSGGPGPVQPLLVPAIIDCDPTRRERLALHAELVARSGVAVEEFGPEALRCTALPSSCAGADAGPVVLGLLDSLGDADEPTGEREHRLAATLACHAAVRFGDRLSPDAQQALLDRLVRTPGGVTCPHGRPTMLRLDGPTLRRAFRRPVM